MIIKSIYCEVAEDKGKYIAEFSAVILQKFKFLRDTQNTSETLDVHFSI